MAKENNFLDPVPPFYDGEGFPYAPTDWPNPGDTWGWKVGRRISASGYYTDRFLIPPRSLQKSTCPKHFASRCSVEHYILKEFPNADIDAFFASFVWRIPSTLSCSGKAKATSHSQKNVEEEKEEIPLPLKWKRKHTAASSSAKRRTRQSLRQAVPKDTDGEIEFCSLNEEAATPNKDTKSTSDCKDDQPENDSIADNRSPLKCMAENFDSYISSLDDILQKPLSEASLANAATINSPTQDDELAEAQSHILEANKTMVISLKKEYIEKKEKVARLQTELESNLLAVREIDDQISKLKSQQVEIMKTVEVKKTTMAELSNDQQKVADAIKKTVHEVQLANSKRAEWELKQENAEKCQAEILTRFGPLK
ncbi:Protein OBERON 1 [Melia azedarach]|uniref:Protein OBERON 1 n=1 Tax=Melia azedarach TaxID=155640 RepID=A0ACC1YG22_MELAZ|nr:Protein OBERON 1 [Melia azedarach]